jgi:hypothetical protein
MPRYTIEIHLVKWEDEGGKRTLWSQASKRAPQDECMMDNLAMRMVEWMDSQLEPPTEGKEAA